VGTLLHAALDLLDPEPDAAEAWALVEAYIQNPSGQTAEVVEYVVEGQVVAAQRPKQLPDRAMKALATLGQNPGNWDPKDLAFRRREFEAEYAKQGQRWRREAQAGRLALPEPKMKVRMIE
jgi:hypothetical protein